MIAKVNKAEAIVKIAKPVNFSTEFFMILFFKVVFVSFSILQIYGKLLKHANNYIKFL